MFIYPTILAATAADFARLVERYQPIATEVQVDFADGQFVPNILLDTRQVAQISTSLQYECHLMVQRPELWVDDLLRLPNVEAIIVHVESEVNIPLLADRVHATGRQFGLAFKPETNPELIMRHSQWIDRALQVCVNPGFNGSPFIPEALRQIPILRSYSPGITIGVDGGMNEQTVAMAASVFVDRAAAGSFMQSGDAAEQLAKLQRAAERAV